MALQTFLLNAIPIVRYACPLKQKRRAHMTLLEQLTNVEDAKYQLGEIVKPFQQELNRRQKAPIYQKVHPVH